MAWRYHGHARVNARRPEAAGICDRCGAMYSRADLNYQFDWRGLQLQNLRILVCPRCLDKPQEQLRARVLGPDPLPIRNPRPEPFAPGGISIDQTNYLFTENFVSMLVAEDGVTFLVREGNNPDNLIGP